MTLSEWLDSKTLQGCMFSRRGDGVYVLCRKAGPTQHMVYCVNLTESEHERELDTEDNIRAYFGPDRQVLLIP